MTVPKILLGAPDYYGIEYEINPWMSRARPSDPTRAVRQWRRLRAILADCGARIWEIDPVPGLPDLVFTANAALIWHKLAVLSRFRHPQRQREEDHFARWFSEHGFQVRQLPDGGAFEGAGDALFCGETLFAGYRLRSDARMHQRIAAMLGCRVIAMELVDPYFYHLDTCFCPLAPGAAFYYPPAFDSYGLRAMEEHIPDRIAVDEDEARRFACNAVVLGRTVVLNTGSTRLGGQLRARGYETIETPLDEFLKAGGSAKCLTLRLDGEDAAAWRATMAATASAFSAD